MQLKVNSPFDVFKWIPYNQFKNIKITGGGNTVTVYSAKWKGGLLYYDCNKRELYERYSDFKVALRCLHNSQTNINKFLDEV